MPITDLTNYVWTPNAIVSGDGNEYFIRFRMKYNGEYQPYYGRSLQCTGSADDIVSTITYWVDRYKSAHAEAGNTLNSWGGMFPFEFIFEGGEDATNPQFIAWLQNNGTLILQTIDCDLTILDGWDRLTDGEHIITVKAKANGYKDSEVSQSVTVTKPVIIKCTVSGLGSENPNDVSFNVDSDFNWNFETVVKDGDTFIKIPKMYRKVKAISDGQITSFSISETKLETNYQVYPCFVREDGTECDYILIGKWYNNSSSRMQSISNTSPTNLAIGTARSLAQARGSGYRLMDWQIFKLWQDLIICKKQTIDTNSGNGIGTNNYDEFGIYWGTDLMWIDGIAGNSKTWVACDKPSSYIDEPTSSTTNYYQLSYSRPTGLSGEVKKLGYDSTHPFVNLPNEVVSNKNYNTYYCDQYTFITRNNPMRYRVGYKDASDGAFGCDTSREWSITSSERLCYQPQN